MASLILTALLALLGIAALVKLGDRVGRLEQRVAKLQRDAIARSAPRASPAVPRESAPASPRAQPTVIAALPPRPGVASPQEPATMPPEPRAARSEAPALSRPLREMAPVPESPEPTPPAALEWVQRWLTTGNVPAKVGVLLSIVGVGFLVKEGIDRHWLVLPLGARLALVAMFGSAMLAVGWRLKARERGYGLSLQGGGIGVLYVTTYAAYALYGLLGATLAFGLLFAVTTVAVVLALFQDARVLVVLAIVGGFLAPVLTATDSGNHVALFSYYTLLDLAIFTIAWFKAWRSLNVLGFLFTFVIGGIWGYDAYRPELFGTVEPFLVLFVALYLVIPVLFALRQPPELRGYVDGTLVFGTPIIGFGLQALLVADTRYGLAISAVVLAAIYGGLSAFVRRYSAQLRVLGEAQFALAVVFLVLALPLAFDARWTSAGWALQGAALVWLGRRQHRQLPLAAGAGLQVAAGVEYVLQPFFASDSAWLNGHWLGALLLAFAGAWSSRLFDVSRNRSGEQASALPAAANAFLVWALAWWLSAGFDEIDRHVATGYTLAADVLFVASTAAIGLLGARLLDWRRLAAIGLCAWPLAVLLFLVGYANSAHPGANLGWIAWPVLCAALFVFLRLRETQFPSLTGALHAIAYWLATALLVSEVRWQVALVATADWAAAAAFTVAAAIVLVTLQVRDKGTWPVGAHARTYVKACSAGVVAALALGVVAANALLAGNPAPLPYLPLANPLELASAATTPAEHALT